MPQVTSRYSVIGEKNPREIVLLRGSGCVWRSCRFCDYHLDFSSDQNENFEINRVELEKITGKFGRLEVINSGSFVDLDSWTMEKISQSCIDKAIRQIHFESHWMHRSEIKALRRSFREIGVDVKMKIGVETFDVDFRENVLLKGMGEVLPTEIAEYFDECCLLFGITGQTEASMRKDIETGFRYFERVCVNIMQENTAPLKPDREIVSLFKKKILSEISSNVRIDVLLENDEFGVY